MDRRVDELQKKLTDLLIEVVEVSAALDQTISTIQRVPHYSVIELRTHDLGQQLRREIQQWHLRRMKTQ
jgi:hypothetical protein